jgi:hypothetical protein
MKKRTKLKTALLLAAAVNMTYAEESCFPPKKDQTPLDVLECISSVQAVQQQQISELKAENQAQQDEIQALLQLILSNGLVAHYPFDGDANDVSGHHGTEYGKVRYVNGIINQARHFDRRDGYEYIIFPNTLSNDEYSISLWFNLKSVGSHHSLLMLNKTSHWGLSNFWLFTSGSRLAVVQQKQDLRKGNHRGVFFKTKKISDSTLYFIFIKYKNKKRTLYLNCEVYAEYNNVAPIQNNSANLNIGVSPSGTGRYQVDGLIDELRIFNRALTELEIQALYKQPQVVLNEDK